MKHLENPAEEWERSLTNKVDGYTMKNAILILVSMIMLGACAKKPDAVEPAKIDHTPYLQLSCSNLAQKQNEGQLAVESLSAKQKAAADNDALGVFLLGLPLASMSGNDPEAQLSIAKGQLNAIKMARASKRCA